MSSARTRDHPTRWRFRRRLTGAFVLVAALSGGVVAVTGYVLIREYRERSFAANAEDQAALGLLVAPPRVSAASAEEFLERLGGRSGFDIVLVADALTLASSSELGRAAVPDELATLPTDGERARSSTTVGGDDYLVIGARRAPDGPAIYFFFSKEELLASIEQFRNAVAVGWLLALAVAGIVGTTVTRRTLRPVREAARASQALAEGLLSARVDVDSNDEFGAWATSFNEMAAALEEKMNALAAAAARERRFSADVAHELRTPLTSLVAAADLLHDHLDTTGGEAASLGRVLRVEIHRLRRLVLELLELSRLESGGAPVDLEVVAVPDAVAAVVERARADAAIEMRFGSDVPLRMHADRVRFARVMGNLVANAVEHGGGGPITIEARRSGPMVEIDVVDQGPGIPDSDIDHVFDRFHKVDGARGGGGFGLGLAIARHHAEAQGGTLRARNDPARGARFTLALPAAGDERE